MEPFIVPATLGALSPIGKYVLDAATSAGLDKKVAYRLRLAVDEIATNAVVHGHAELNPPGVLQVLAELGPHALSIILEDTGDPYDPRQAPRPEHLDQPLEDRPIGGLGVYLVLQGVDEFLYERVGERNRNTFIMRRTGSAAEATLESDKLAYDLLNVIIPIGMALSGEKNFDVLLELILTQAKAVCNADGGTLYLRDGDFLKFAIMRNDSLQIAVGGPTGKTTPPVAALRLYDEDGAPNHANVASYVALQGRSINIPDIYNAKDFDFTGTRTFDQQNNYHSISTFTVPLTNHDSEVIGVLQLLNAQDPQTHAVIPFDGYMQKLVEALASQASIVLNNQILLERQKELLRVEHELQIGRQIQTSFLPTQLPQVSGWEIAASFSPAREVAGDFYDAFSLQDDTKVCLVIADVCDKGVGAALFMALSRSLIHAFAEWQQAGVGNPIEFTNEYILRNHLQANMFITLFFGVLEPSTGLLSYVNSGHNPPVIIGATGVKTHLLPTGPATGIFPDWTFQLHQVYLEPGDVLFAYTDGVTEARNADGDFFTDKRLLQLLEEPAASAADLLQRVEESVRSYSAFADQSDDITMLVARRRLLHES